MLFINFDKTVSKVELTTDLDLRINIQVFIVQILVNIQIFPLVGETRLRLVPPTRANICIYMYTRKIVQLS